ncbi:MAG: CTP synthase [Desulfurococcales archaeon]|nr:CTP synthase [Desulfurococcales archaeon]
MKYIFVTGGVLSSVGKGITAASIGFLLKQRGFSVTMIKIDPYINVDAGTMNPYMHGEVFVTEDGGETDLDLGHYERFLDINLTKNHNITTGKVYLSVITKERKGEYLGQTVQVIPHITNEIKDMIRSASKESHADISIVELGGTVGDIEGLPFLEAIRQMGLEEGPKNSIYIHVALAPTLSTTGEQKTKPIQHSVTELRRIGIQPQIVVARSIAPLEEEARRKISLYASIPKKAVISNYDVDTIYRVPLILEEQDLPELILDKLDLNGIPKPDLAYWKEYVDTLSNAQKEVRISMVGKYVKLKDSYLSIIEALKHAGASFGVKPRLKWFEATDIERGKIDVEKVIEDTDAVIVLPGFGKRGFLGKIEAIRVARESETPFMGICLGMQLSVVEAARNLLGLRDANTTEFDPNTPHPVVVLQEEQKRLKQLGGTMRLGAKPIRILPGTTVHKLYGRDVIVERHRHRYEVNPDYIDRLESVGLKVSAVSLEDELRVEAIEYDKKVHKFFIAYQPHPEFKSRPLRPSPAFRGIVAAALGVSV